MAIKVNCPESSEKLSLEEFLARCDKDLNVGDEASIAAMGPSLAALARNKDFFCEYFKEFLSSIATRGASALGELPANSEQTFTIARRPNYYVRVATWPLPKDRGDKKDGDNKFYSYNFAHNHAFSLLTVGLLGPGYLSNNFSLEVPPSVLNPGDPIVLTPGPDQILSEGQVLLYRKWYDVHIQNPCSEFSMSLNLMVGDDTIPQYSFDVEKSTVGEHIAGKGYAAKSLSGMLRNLRAPIGSL